MSEIESITEVEPGEIAELPKPRFSTVSRIGLGVICGFALIVTIMPTCSCSGRTRQVETEQRRAAIEEAIRGQSNPVSGHGRTVTAKE